MKSNKKKFVMLGVGLIVTVVALYLSTRQVSFKDFVSEIKNFKLWWLVPALAMFYFSLYLRAVRWGLFFRPYHKLKGYQVFRPLTICFGFNCLLPGRVGEVMRAWLVGTRKQTGVATALATVVAERVLDSVTLIGMLAFSLAILPPMDPTMPPIHVWGYSVQASQFNQLSHKIVLLSAILVTGMIVFMIPLTQRIMHRLIEASPLKAGLKGKLRHLLDQFAQGFHALQQPWVLVQILFHSVALWVLIGVSNLMVARGFGLAMTLPQAVALMVIIAIFITVPATPGYWGLFEAGTIFSLIVLRVLPVEKQSQALAYALMTHLVQYLPLVAMGLLFAWQMQVKPTAAEALTEEIEEEPADGADAAAAPEARSNVKVTR
jgi:uncharacterized protein (TIRG00374 family)